uniref:Uncharacterized protein n=1 Tax=Caenorhabditis tropicalis TaxID=1561998 RepID=A0A1I7UP08_9PELO
MSAPSSSNGINKTEKMAEESVTRVNAQPITEIAPMAESLEARRIPEPAEKTASWGTKFIAAFDDHMADFYKDMLSHVKTLQ